MKLNASSVNFACTGNCTDYTGTYRCTCDPGYSGLNCTIDIDECDSSPCEHGEFLKGIGHTLNTLTITRQHFGVSIVCLQTSRFYENQRFCF